MNRFNKIIITICVLLSLLMITHASFASQDVKDKQAILEKAAKIQMPFIKNNGQIQDSHVRFYTKTFGGTAFVTDKGEIVYSLSNRQETITKALALKEELVGSNIKEIKGEDKAEAPQVSYFRGNDPSRWKSGIPTYNTVNLGEIYKGIDLKLRAYGKNVEKLFYVKPEGKPEDIRVKIDGAKGIKVNGKGELEVDTELGVVRFTRPVAYQEIDGKRKEVKVEYSIQESANSNQQLAYRFRVGDYDKTNELIIDPLLASTFLGGSDDDGSKTLAIDSSGNVYVAGETSSEDFPATAGAFDTSFNGYVDVFISKLNSSLRSLLASTFLGGSDSDWSHALAIDSSGNVYVAGETYSSNFPTTAGAYDTSINSYYYRDGFVSKLGQTYIFEEADPAISYSGTWNNYSCTSCSGGALKYSNETGAKATFTFNGTGIKWIVSIGPILGKAKVYFDGSYLCMVDLYNPAAQWQVVLQKTGLTSGSHTVILEVSGQKNSASNGYHIDIDAFEVIP